MSRKNPVPPCYCGFQAKNGSSAGMAHHLAKCPQAIAASQAFTKAIEEGRPNDAVHDSYAAARAART